ncbi:hypothetical protein [Homoserinibacter gongjuensis]|uniref:Uncharacterized protein n=1 Tax=Homoserinibacter gongjuensis TaxID=1162968 RepID=A0ABQ6JS32_9MICO|nr:hypothetical protein [Homoserinibacter gongjuensis]GMA91121.1 hypothetical protein GCM10025869_16500 [Homoserinibacter gongjuensis]
MAGRTEPRRRPWGPVGKVVAGATVAATVITLAIVAQGYDAQEIPRLETSVWVTRADGQYGRVNTDLAELDTVRAVADPSGVVQAGDSGVVFTQGFGQAWAIDPAAPVDLGAGDDEQGRGRRARRPRPERGRSRQRETASCISRARASCTSAASRSTVCSRAPRS